MLISFCFQVKVYKNYSQAELVTTSAYETIANAQRAELEARGGKPIVDPGRPNWNQFFGNTHHGGFFADWFSGW